MINELERVVLKEDLEGLSLKAGDVGTVVMVYGAGQGYEVEFMTLDGETLAVLTLTASQVRQVRPGEITHVRQAVPGGA